MRDIGARIQRYRLSRYGSPHATFLRQLRWAWPILGLWLAYVALFSEHSLLRIWRLSRESDRIRTELAETQQALERLESQMKDPRARRDHAERTLRERSGWVRQDEQLYRIPGEGADSLPR